MDIWVMRMDDGWFAVSFLSDRAKVWADHAEYYTLKDFPFIIGPSDYQELRNNLDPEFAVMDDEGRNQ